MSDIQETLQERESTHGRFEDNAALTEELMKLIRGSNNWQHIPPIFKVALFMICHKIARALSGDFQFDDHWKDIQGYAKLIEDYCKSKSK